MSDQIQNGEPSERDGQKVYSEEFRANAVKMVTALGLSNGKVAERLGCSEESVRRWVIAHRRKELKPVLLQPELDAAKELQAARKRIDQLEKENEFLKKAAAYFAKESK